MKRDLDAELTSAHEPGLSFRSVSISAGPLDVLGESDGDVLDDDLREAALAALQIPRDRPRARALGFDWTRVCTEFVAFLAPIGQIGPVCAAVSDPALDATPTMPRAT